MFFFLLKVIIRRLPPSMSEQTFLEQIVPLPEHDYFYYVPADWSLGQHASSRAYINFTQLDDVFQFKDKFDGYVFVDTKGVEYPAIVEFAPFQSLPKGKSRKTDNKCGTIETDPHFISFFAALNNEGGGDEGGLVGGTAAKTEMKMEYSYQIKDGTWRTKCIFFFNVTFNFNLTDKKITSTPLLEFLASKKQERRDEKRRKNEDKKKQRDDEKNRKKDDGSARSSSMGVADDKKKRDSRRGRRKDVANTIPDSIPEEVVFFSNLNQIKTKKSPLQRRQSQNSYLFHQIKLVSTMFLLRF